MNSPELAPDERIAEQLDREHIRPAYRWRGRELWPYCLESEMTCAHAGAEEDTQGFRWLSFIYIHLRRTEKTFADDAYKHGILEAAWNATLFRLKILQWMAREKITDADYLEAKAIYEETLATSAATRAMALDTRTDEEKRKDEAKKKESSQEAPPSAPTPSPSPSGPETPDL